MCKAISRYANYFFKSILKYSFIGFFLCVVHASFSQEKSLYKEAKSFVHANPDESIKIATHLSKLALSDIEKAELDFLIAQSYLVKGNYNNTGIYIYRASKENLNAINALQAKIDLLKTELLRNLYLDNQSRKYLEEAKQILPSITSKQKQDSLEAAVLLEKTAMHVDRNEFDEALQLLEESKDIERQFASNNNIIQRFFILKGKALSGKINYDLAYRYFQKALNIAEASNPTDYYHTALIHYQLGDLFLKEKDHKKAENSFAKALKAAQQIENVPLQEQITRSMSMNYLALNDKIKHKTYNNDFLVLNTKAEQLEQESINTLYSLINKEQESVYQQKEEKYDQNIYVTFGVFVIILFICAIVFFKSEGKRKRLTEIVNYLEISRSNFLKVKPKKTSTSKKVSIPPETEQTILEKLKKFEQSTKYTAKDMSLAVLAGQFETNTKYLSEIINKHYNDNFNTFINKLRIKYIINKLKTDANYMHYKISFLAEKSGFSSHSSFATVFKSIVGMSPATFINLLNEEKENEGQEK